MSIDNPQVMFNVHFTKHIHAKSWCSLTDPAAPRGSEINSRHVLVFGAAGTILVIGYPMHGETLLIDLPAAIIHALVFHNIII